MELAPIDPAAPCASVVDMLETKASKKNVTLHFDVDDSVRAVGDARACDHVLLNLVDNAIKFTPEGGNVWVRFEGTAGNRARFEVADDGPGIAAAHRERLFERFYRIDPGRSRDMGGTGLGLAIVKHLGEAMGGEVGMEPRAGGGSIFFLELPAA